MDSSDNSLPHNGQDTSIAAAESMEAIAVQDRVRVLKRLVMIEPDGTTADAMQMHLRLEHQSNSPRFVELRDDGLIFDTETRLPTRSGRGAIVWRPTSLGINGIEAGWYHGDRINTAKRESRISIMRSALAEALRGWAANTSDLDQLARIAALEPLTRPSTRRT